MNLPIRPLDTSGFQITRVGFGAWTGASRDPGRRTSLRRLGVERIDLYQFHWPDNTGTGAKWRVRYVDSLQPPFSLIHRQLGADVIPRSAAHGKAVIVYPINGRCPISWQPGSIAESSPSLVRHPFEND